MNRQLLLYILYGILVVGTVLFVICGLLILRNDNSEALANVVSAYEDYYSNDCRLDDNVSYDASGGDATETEYNHEKYGDKAILKDVDSILIIPSVDLAGPVYTGPDRMKYLEEFAFITGYEENVYGSGAYYIFGHQSRTYGKSFNRIKELAIGDEVIINQSGILYQYQITAIETTYTMEIDKSSDAADRLYIYTCKKSTAKDKPYIKVTAEILQ